MPNAKALICLLFLLQGLFSCIGDGLQVASDRPGHLPIPFMPHVVPAGMLVHSGILAPDRSAYYFTLSDPAFTQFDVYVARWNGKDWSSPEATFFNSEFNEHGTSFSADGRFVYFSSTHPVTVEGALDTWHLWRSELIGEKWEKPELIDIPNMRGKLQSHPSASRDGTLYFHAGNPDYSELDLYSSSQVEGVYQDAVRMPATINTEGAEVTPFIDPDGNYLLFDRAPDLFISFRDALGQWTVAQPLSDQINSNGKGNPFVTSDGEQLLFVASLETDPGEPETWSVFCVNDWTLPVVQVSR